MRTFDGRTGGLVAILGTVPALGIPENMAYAKLQEQITQSVIDAFQVKSRYKRLVNIGGGILFAGGMTAVGAAWLHAWEIVPAGVLAGILAAVEAGKQHDAQSVSSSPTAETEMPSTR